jgi:hypothetical protein
MANEIQTAESAAIEKFVAPAAEQVRCIHGIEGESIFVLPANGIQVRSDAAYERAGLALRTVREKRKALAVYFKEQPNGNPGPGQGLCYFARRAWESAQSLFNRFDLQFKQWDEAIDGGMKHYRQEVEEKARVEAEARAAKERERLEAEAKKVAKKDPELAKEYTQMAAAVIPIVQREAPQAAGVSVRKVWKACPAKVSPAVWKLLTPAEKARAWTRQDLLSLVKAVAERPELLGCLAANESGCNDLAVSFGGVNAPAGLKFYQDDQTTTRKVK